MVQMLDSFQSEEKVWPALYILHQTPQYVYIAQM